MRARALLLYLGLAAVFVALVDLLFYQLFDFDPLTVGGVIGGVLVIVLVDALMDDLPTGKKPDEDQDVD